MQKNALSYALIFCLCASQAKAQATFANDPEFDEILSQDISQLTVSSVSKRDQRLTDTAAAVYVITQEQIRRAGIYSIPDALRLVPGMQVAKISGDRWAVSSRGFNGSLSNKLLVLIDGRAIYTPVFSGVYWGDQSTTINDIERIEVIRGPGATIYGANAVNGVINIITKSAMDTQGQMLSATATAKGNGVYEARHGGKIGDDTYYRAYGQYYDGEVWYRERAGFRADGKISDSKSFTVQGDVYNGEQKVSSTLPTAGAPFSQRVRTSDDAYGGNVLGRWNHKLSSHSDVSLQAYVDHYTRNEASADQHISTADVQAQHSVALDARNNFIWGGGARLYYQNIKGSYAASVDDRYDTHHIFNIFAQDEYAIVPDKLFFTAGSKLEYNDLSGIEVQPSVRLAWHPTTNQTVWAAVSRAVRTPSSIEQDISLVASVTPGAPPTETRLNGNRNQRSEELIAYEVGHRIQPRSDLSFDTALFYNVFSDLQTYSSAGAAFIGDNGNSVLPFTFSNLGSGKVYGTEFATSWNVTQNWRLAGSYAYLKMELDASPETAVTLDPQEDLAPRNQFSLQSYYNINERLHWDNLIYYVDEIGPTVPAYVRYDTRVAYMLVPGMEVSFIARNQADPHREFATTAEIERSYIAQVLWKF